MRISDWSSDVCSSDLSVSMNTLPLPLTFEIDSMPPATQMSWRSTMICFAAVAIVISPDEHCRSIDMPGTVTGRPARSADRKSVVEGKSESVLVDLGGRRIITKKNNYIQHRTQN